MPSKPTVYPRAGVRKLVKAHSNLNVSKNVDVLVYLDYVLFMQELLREAGIKARERGAAPGTISAADVRKVTENTLRKFKG